MIPQLHNGDRLHGTDIYEIVDSIGHGGLSTVYRVQSSNGWYYAAKVPSDHRFPLDERAITRLNRELTLLREVRHRHVLQIVDVAQHAGLPVSITPFAAGGDLHRRILGKPPLLLSTAFDWIIQIASGLAALHERGIVHRDLTPKNVFFIDDDRLVIGDLGIARHLNDATLTELTDHIGSLIYISAQQREAPHDANFADDVFSLGQIAFFILTSIPPHGGLMELAKFRPDCPEDWISIIEILRSHDRADRPESASDLFKVIFSLHPEPARFLEQPDSAVVGNLRETYQGGSVSDGLHLDSLKLLMKPQDWDKVLSEVKSLPDLRCLAIQNGSGTPAEQAGRFTGNWASWYYPRFSIPPEVPTSVKGLEVLEELDLSCCGLASWTEGIEGLTGLRRLSVRGNYLAELPEWLCRLTNLEELDLSENEIYEIDLSLFTAMPRLSRLILYPMNDDLRADGYGDAIEINPNPLKGTPPIPEGLRELRVFLGKHWQGDEIDLPLVIREYLSGIPRRSNYLPPSLYGN